LLAPKIRSLDVGGKVNVKGGDHVHVDVNGLLDAGQYE
jgi:hypothetical protein